MGQGVESGQNLRYLVGFNFPPHEVQELGVIVPYMIHDNVLVITPEGEPTLIMARPEIDLAKKQTWLADIRSIADKLIGRYQGIVHVTREILHKKRKARIGIAGSRVPMKLVLELTKALPKTKFVPCTYDLDLLRAIKSPNELRIMRKAAQIADKGVGALIETSKPGVAEYEVHMAVEKEMFDAGGDNPWSIVLSGPRSAIPYLSPDYTQRKLREGDMVYADIGTEFMGYHSDIQPAYIVGRGTGPSTNHPDLPEDAQSHVQRNKTDATDTEVLRAAYNMLDGIPSVTI